MRGFNWLEYTEVMELVDAHDSASYTRKCAEVRVFSSASFSTSFINQITYKFFIRFVFLIVNAGFK